MSKAHTPNDMPSTIHELDKKEGGCWEREERFAEHPLNERGGW